MNKDEVCTFEAMVAPIIDKKCPVVLRVDRFSFLDENGFFANYFSNTEEFKKIRDEFNERNKVVARSGITSRVLSHWLDEEILPEGVSPNGNDWKKFSIVELVWIRAVVKMRDYGVSLGKISNVRSWVMQYDKQTDTYPWFEYYITLARISEQDPYIVILPDGTAELATLLDIEYIKHRNKNTINHFLLISLKGLLKELGFNVVRAERLELLTKAERGVRSAILGGGKEINMKIKRDYIEMDTIEEPFDKTKISELGKEIEKSDLFGDLTLKFSDGKLQFTSIRKKKRFKR